MLGGRHALSARSIVASGGLATLWWVDSRPPSSSRPRIEGFIRRAVTSKRVFPYLVAVTAALGLLAGLLVRVIDHRDFPDYGTAVWWAVVTLATVGYGDVVPHTGWGRVVGSVVIVVGVTLLSFLIAIVTSYFVSLQEDEKAARERARRDEELDADRELLERIEQRLSSIEARLPN